MEVATLNNWISSRATLMMRKKLKNWDEVKNWNEELVGDDVSKTIKYVITTPTLQYYKEIANPNITWVGYNLQGKSCKSWCYLEQLEIFNEFLKTVKTKI